MMQFEFERIAGYKVSNEDYENIIEPMYMATGLDKYEFVGVINRERFEIKKSNKHVEQEEKIKTEITRIEREIDFIKKEIEIRERVLSQETDGLWVNTWKSEIKRYNNDINFLENRIKDLKWLLNIM